MFPSKWSSIPGGLVWYTNLAALSFFGNSNMPAMTSREIALYTTAVKATEQSIGKIITVLCD